MAEQPVRGKLKREPAEALAALAPWKPPVPSPEQIGALRALYDGRADAVTQRMAFDYIMQLCYNGGLHYFPGESGRRDTDFALGRAWVGQMLRTIVGIRVHPRGEHG